LKRPDKPWRFSRCRGCKREVAAANRRARAAEPKPAPPIVEPFPADFLRFRELACAYRDHRTKRYVRAVNNWYQVDAYRQLTEHNRLVVVLPPGHLKTTFFSIEYPTWRIMGDRNVRITAIQKNQEEAKKLVGAVEQRLSDVAYYDHLADELVGQGEQAITNPLTAWFRRAPFRPTNRMVGESWGAYTFGVLGTNSGEKDYTMEAKGVGGQIQGVRADLIILDDVQDPQQAVKSVQDSNDKLRWFNDVILGRVTEAQQVIVLCNYFSPDDFAHKLLAAHPEFACVEYPALIPEDGPGGDGELVPLCPEFWTAEALEFKRREVGDQTWFYTWMQEVGSFETATFRREALEAARDGDYHLGEVPTPVSDLFLGMDPAIADSGFCAMVVWGLCRKTKQRYLVDLFNKRGMRSWDNVARQIVEFCTRYPIRKVIIERNNTQQSLAFSQTLVREVRSTGAKIDTYQTVTGIGGRAEQTNFDISTVGGLFDAGLITLPYAGDSTEIRRVDEYIDQLVSWRVDDEGHSIKHLVRDLVMSTLFAESEAFALANRSETHVKIRSQVKPPRWVTMRYTNARRAADERREYEAKVNAAQERAQRVGRQDLPRVDLPHL